MAAYASLTLSSLIGTTNEVVIDRLLRSDAVSGFTQVAHNQIVAWREQLDLLRDVAEALIRWRPAIGDASLVLEYRIPRREKRIDAAILLDRTVVIIEFKVGASRESADAIEQVLDYTLDLAYYHAATREMTVAPVLCATKMAGESRGPASDVALIQPLVICGNEQLLPVLTQIASSDSLTSSTPMDADGWVSPDISPATHWMTFGGQCEGFAARFGSCRSHYCKPGG